MDVSKCDVENGDEQFVCKWIYEAAKSRRLIGKVTSNQPIKLMISTTTTAITKHIHSFIKKVHIINVHACHFQLMNNRLTMADFKLVLEVYARGIHSEERYEKTF